MPAIFCTLSYIRQSDYWTASGVGDKHGTVTRVRRPCRPPPGMLAAQPAAPINVPIAAVTPMANALQNVIRIIPVTTFALPIWAATPPRNARNKSEATAPPGRQDGP